MRTRPMAVMTPNAAMFIAAVVAMAEAIKARSMKTQNEKVMTAPKLRCAMTRCRRFATIEHMCAKCHAEWVRLEALRTTPAKATPEAVLPMVTDQVLAALVNPTRID